MAFIFSHQFDTISSDFLTLRIYEKDPGDEAMLPFYFYDISTADGEFVGKISIRIGHNYHSYYNGNIGYEIFEAHRGHGYAASACRMVLDVARHHQMEHLILTCNENNAASYKTIEKLGGSLLEICDMPRDYFAWYEGIERHRIYRLDL